MKYFFSDLCAQNGCKSWRTKWWKPDPSESAGVNIIQSITNLITGEHESEWCNAGFDGRPWERSGGWCWPSWKDDRLQELLKGDVISIALKGEKDMLELFLMLRVWWTLLFWRPTQTSFVTLSRSANPSGEILLHFWRNWEINILRQGSSCCPTVPLHSASGHKLETNGGKHILLFFYHLCSGDRLLRLVGRAPHLP